MVICIIFNLVHYHNQIFLYIYSTRNTSVWWSHISSVQTPTPAPWCIFALFCSALSKICLHIFALGLNVVADSLFHICSYSVIMCLETKTQQRRSSSSTATPPCGLSHLFHPHTHLWPTSANTAGCLHLVNPPLHYITLRSHTHSFKPPCQWIAPLLSPSTVLHQSSRLSSCAAGRPQQLSPWLPARITPNRETDVAPEEERAGVRKGGGCLRGSVVTKTNQQQQSGVSHDEVV